MKMSVVYQYYNFRLSFNGMLIESLFSNIWLTWIENSSLMSLGYSSSKLASVFMV